MGALDGRVAIITGAGRGLGREHALLFAREGAKVVVNDLGGAADGTGGDLTPAEEVVKEIEAGGGEAVANGDNVADWEGAQRLVNAAIERFGDLDILVNNAGILRDRVVVNMTEEEWDAVIAVHLKGHFAPTRWAAAYWREQHKAGQGKPRNLVHTSSTSGLFSNPGQANYGAAKAGIYALTRVAALELEKVGIAVNAIAPVALTRMTSDLQMMRGASERELGPHFVAPVAVFLASDLSRGITGQVVGVQGGKVFLYRMETSEGVERDPAQGPWSAAELAQEWARISR
jgi:NAD(P)-dependent dehydrogenase (short-subunit alcohol dehydrogenase family)